MAGLELIDLRPIWEAAGGASSKALWRSHQPASKMDFSDELLLEAGARENPDGIGPKVACCVGKATVTFQLVGARIKVTGSKYDPKGWNK